MKTSIGRNLGAYDVVVVGGGMAGVSAAYTAAKEGRKTVVVEPTGSLGREMVRARNLFIDLSRYVNDLPVVAALYQRLEARKGWFNGMVDTNCAAVALDDVLEDVGVDVLFQGVGSQLATEGGSIAGIQVATKSGYGLLKAPTVVDASARGKIGRAYYQPENKQRAASAIHLLYNNVKGECPGEAQLEIPEYGHVAVKFRPTYWDSEWRVSLYVDRYVERDRWTLLLKDALASLHEQAPALTSGVLTYIADDIWAEPDFVLSAAAETGTEAVMTNPNVRDGLILSGLWLAGFQFNLHNEEQTLMNAVRLGQSAGQLVGAIKK